MKINLLYKIINFCKKFSTLKPTKYNLVGRNLLIPNDLTTEEIKSLLWTAIELKTLSYQKHRIDFVKDSKITLLMNMPLMNMEVPAREAARFLNAKLNVVVDPTWDSHYYVQDIGTYLALYSDLILCQSKYHKKIETMSSFLNIPVIITKSSKLMILQALTDMMTLQMHYGYLKGLNFAWIGPPRALFNTYLCIIPKLGLNISYLCSCASNAKLSPAMLKVAQETCTTTQTALTECSDASSVRDNSQVLAISNHNNPNLKITFDLMKSCKHNWSILYCLPRGCNEMESELFNSARCLVWQSASNTKWILSALILRLMHDYKHITDKPNFDNKK